MALFERFPHCSPLYLPLSRTLDEPRGLGCNSLIHEDSRSLFSPRRPSSLHTPQLGHSSFAHLHFLQLSTVSVSSPLSRHWLRSHPLQNTLEVYSLLTALHICIAPPLRLFIQPSTLHTTVDSRTRSAIVSSGCMHNHDRCLRFLTNRYPTNEAALRSVWKHKIRLITYNVKHLVSAGCVNTVIGDSVFSQLATLHSKQPRGRSGTSNTE